MDQPMFLPGCESWHQMHRRMWLGKSATGLVAGITGLAMTQIAEALAKESESARTDGEGKRTKSARSIIYLWMQGGPSQLETFDPHAGTKSGGDTKAISTTIPKVDISDFLPRTAEQMHLTTLIRSMVSKEGDHERASYHLKTGWRPDPTLIHPSIGAVVCHQTQDNLEIPRHISILTGQWPPRGGYMGGQYDAFQTGDPRDPLPNLIAPPQIEKMSKKVAGLSEIVEQEFARARLEQLDMKKTQHVSATARAIQMMASDQIKAFDISGEASDSVKRFGDTSFGRGCLAAVRLVEQGVRCVEVELSGWDTHINNHELQKGRCNILDEALAATLYELEARDLLDQTVVICGGEFGRTPEINVTGGRDHWPTGFSTLIAGGPFRRGYVHGATPDTPSEDATKRWDEIENSVTVQELHATLLASLGIDPTKELMTPIGRPLVLSEGKILTDLFSI